MLFHIFIYTLHQSIIVVVIVIVVVVIVVSHFHQWNVIINIEKIICIFSISQWSGPQNTPSV